MVVFYCVSKNSSMIYSIYPIEQVPEVELFNDIYGFDELAFLYPGMPEEDFLKACPVCRNVCNYISMFAVRWIREKVKFSDE
ncbi:hypothetical protein P3L10_011314 [Capsicum annuum]